MSQPTPNRASRSSCVTRTTVTEPSAIIVSTRFRPGRFSRSPDPRSLTTLTISPSDVARSSSSCSARDDSSPDEPETRTYRTSRLRREVAKSLPRFKLSTSTEENRRSRPTHMNGILPSMAHWRSVIG